MKFVYKSTEDQEESNSTVRNWSMYLRIIEVDLQGSILFDPEHEHSNHSLRDHCCVGCYRCK